MYLDSWCPTGGPVGGRLLLGGRALLKDAYHRGWASCEGLMPHPTSLLSASCESDMWWTNFLLLMPCHASPPSISPLMHLYPSINSFFHKLLWVLASITAKTESLTQLASNGSPSNHLTWALPCAHPTVSQCYHSQVQISQLNLFLPISQLRQGAAKCCVWLSLRYGPRQVIRLGMG